MMARELSACWNQQKMKIFAQQHFSSLFYTLTSLLDHFPTVLHPVTMMFRSALIATLFATASAFAPALHTSTLQRNSALNGAVDTSDIKNGMTIELDGEPYKVLNFSIMKQARGAAKTTIKFKNLMRGTTIENTYRSGEKFQTAMIEKKAAQYTYSDETGNFYFMDSETFEEIMVEVKMMEDINKWIVEGMECSLVYFKGKVMEVVVPNYYVYEVIETEPSLKGSTVSALTKPAKVGAGAIVTVPGFIEQGTSIKVDTVKAEYLERA